MMMSLDVIEKDLAVVLVDVVAWPPEYIWWLYVEVYMNADMADGNNKRKMGPAGKIQGKKSHQKSRDGTENTSDSE